MITVLFFEWLIQIDQNVYRLGRKFFLLVDNCSAHGTELSIPKMGATEVILISPNNTSVIE